MLCFFSVCCLPEATTLEECQQSISSYYLLDPAQGDADTLAELAGRESRLRLGNLTTQVAHSRAELSLADALLRDERAAHNATKDHCARQSAQLDDLRVKEEALSSSQQRLDACKRDLSLEKQVGGSDRERLANCTGHLLMANGRLARLVDDTADCKDNTTRWKTRAEEAKATANNCSSSLDACEDMLLASPASDETVNPVHLALLTRCREGAERVRREREQCRLDLAIINERVSTSLLQTKPGDDVLCVPTDYSLIFAALNVVTAVFCFILGSCLKS